MKMIWFGYIDAAVAMAEYHIGATSRKDMVIQLTLFDNPLFEATYPPKMLVWLMASH
jgi:hypothetical protein